MTLEELAETLPNGLHDAQVTSIQLDFVARVATFHLSVWMGSDAEPEARRDGVLTLRGLEYFAVEPPDGTYPFAKPEPLWISDVIATDPTLGLPSPKSGVFASSLFVNQWNAFVRLAANEAALDWLVG